MTIRKKLFISHFLVVLLVCGGVGSYFYDRVVDNLMQKLRIHLETSAPLVKQCVEVSYLDEIVREADIENTQYQHYLERLRTFKHGNPFVASLFLLRQEGNEIYYVIDTDETGNQSLPGVKYRNAKPELFEGFSQLYLDKKIWTDKWGSFLSGYIPLHGGEFPYLVGLNINASGAKKEITQIRIYGAIAIGVSVLMALFFSRAISTRLITPIQVLVTRCRAIAEGRLDQKIDLKTSDELNELITAFNTMSDDLSESRDQRDTAESELKKTLDELEERVEERTRDLKEANEQLLEEIAERKKAEKALEEAARTDSLTGLLNRRAMLEKVNIELQHFKNEQKPFSVLLCDIDFFKKINDSYGHPEGDKVIIDIGKCLNANVRAQDVVARWGGEEFLLLLPDTDVEGAANVAEKIRSNLSQTVKISTDPDKVVTMSIGVSEYSHEQRIEECIKAADDALYSAKSGGRNCVIKAA